MPKDPKPDVLDNRIAVLQLRARSAIAQLYRLDHEKAVRAAERGVIGLVRLLSRFKDGAH